MKSLHLAQKKYRAVIWFTLYKLHFITISVFSQKMLQFYRILQSKTCKNLERYNAKLWKLLDKFKQN